MAKKPKQEEIPMEGPGIAPVKDKKLDALCDSFIDTRDSKAKLAEELGETEAKILDRMGELGIKVHKFGDQIATIKEGKNHVKIRTVKAESNGEAEEDDTEN